MTAVIPEPAKTSLITNKNDSAVISGEIWFSATEKTANEIKQILIDHSDENCVSLKKVPEKVSGISTWLLYVSRIWSPQDVFEFVRDYDGATVEPIIALSLDRR